MIASSAGSALGRFAASMATDSTLRDRLLELEALASLARRIAGLTREDEIADELLAALRRVGKLDGAVYGAGGGLRPGGQAVVRRDGDSLAELTAFLGELEAPPESTRLDFGEGGSELVFIPMPAAGGRDLFLAGVGLYEADDQRDRVMATLARYGSVALENAHLHDRQREAIARLERQQVETAGQNTKLERVLSVHETLALAVLEGSGLESVVRSLGRFMDAEMLVLGPQLASWRAGPRMRPSTGARSSRPTASPAPWPAASVIGAARRTRQRGRPHPGLDHRPSRGAARRGRARGGGVRRAARGARSPPRADSDRGGDTAAWRPARGPVQRERGDRGGADRALALGYDLGLPSRVFLVEAAPATQKTGARRRTPSRSSSRWPTARASGARTASWRPVAGRWWWSHPRRLAAAERRFEDELQAVARTALPAASLNIAVGTACEEIADYRDSYLAARRGLDLLRLLGRPGEMFSFRVSTLDSMLLQSNRPEVLVKFIARYVDPLDRYDRTHTRELRRTLEVYFESGSTLQEAARRLHVHVSTLRYRLGKAADLLEVDLKDGSAALDVQVALKAARVLALHRG